MDAPKGLRGQLSPEYRAAKERLWRAAHNLRERAVAYGEGGTTAADADLRTRLRARRARGRRSDSGGAADAG
jgi:hypothetical protein